MRRKHEEKGSTRREVGVGKRLAHSPFVHSPVS